MDEVNILYGLVAGAFMCIFVALVLPMLRSGHIIRGSWRLTNVASLTLALAALCVLFTAAWIKANL